jgi:hypothetical protein
VGTLVRLKRLLTGDESSKGRYECLDCRATFERRQQVCPECEGYDIRSTEWLDEQSDAHSPEENA